MSLPIFYRWLRRYGLWLLLLGAVCWRLWRPDAAIDTMPLPSSGNAAPTVQQAFAQAHSQVQLAGEGRVAHILPDDRHGSRHQRFILKLADGHTVLVAHNIDLAPRLNGLRVGDTVAFYGEYAYNSQGGVIHWTHHDPAGRHADGWLQYRGRRYQ